MRPAGIFVGEALDHAVAEAGFVIEDVMGDPEPFGDGARVVNVAAGAAGLRPPDRLAMVVELEGDPDHLGAGAGGERGDDRAVDPARHGDDDSGLGSGPVELEIGDHDGRYIGALEAKAQPEAPSPSFPRTRESSSESALDSRVRGNDEVDGPVQCRTPERH